MFEFIGNQLFADKRINYRGFFFCFFTSFTHSFIHSFQYPFRILLLAIVIKIDNIQTKNLFVEIVFTYIKFIYFTIFLIDTIQRLS